MSMGLKTLSSNWPQAPATLTPVLLPMTCALRPYVLGASATVRRTVAGMTAGCQWVWFRIAGGVDIAAGASRGSRNEREESGRLM